MGFFKILDFIHKIKDKHPKVEDKHSKVEDKHPKVEEINYSHSSEYYKGLKKGLSTYPRVGFDIDLSLKISKQEDMSDEDYEAFIRYIVSNNLELYYNGNGFMIRKNNFK